MKVGKMFDNELKKNLCKRVINKQLAQTAFSIDGTNIFQTYKVQLIVLNDHIT